MRQRRICIDIDNVLCRTDMVIRAIIRDVTQERVDLRYEDVRDFAYQNCVDQSGDRLTDAEWTAVHAVFSDRKHILQAQPYPGVQDHLKQLATEFELHLATSRLPQARGPTIEWLELHEFPMHCMHFVGHGQKHRILADLAAAVEDDYAQASAFAGVGVSSYLLAHPWNISKPGKNNLVWVETWQELVTSLLSS